MEWENIILIGACFAAIIVVAYYFWKKSQTQSGQIIDLTKRIEAIELTFAPQPSHATLDKFFPVSSQMAQPQTTHSTYYVHMPQHLDGTHAHNPKIVDFDTVLDDNLATNKSSRSSQVDDDNDLSPFLIKTNRNVDIDAITDNLLPVISSK